MELDFGDIWDLRRSPAVDGMETKVVLQLMGERNYGEILPSISEDRLPGTINGGELGCVLSHLTAIRRAYLDGNDMAMVVEDDITPLLMQVTPVLCAAVFLPLLFFVWSPLLAPHIIFFFFSHDQSGRFGQTRSWT